MTQQATPGRFRQEVSDQGRALRDLVSACQKHPGPLEEAARLIGEMPDGARLYFTGMGSSLFASYAACCRLWEHAVAATWCEAGELLHYQRPVIRSGDVVVMVSQSGETVEICRLLDAFDARVQIVGVTNDPGSTLAKQARVVLPMHAERERMSTSKTYTNTLLLLRALARRATSAEPWDLAARSLPDLVEQSIARWDTRADELAVFFDSTKMIDFIARGPAYATALQSSVILKEGAHVVCEALSGATFRHGPIEAGGAGHGAVVFAPRGAGFDAAVTLASDLVKLGSKTAVVTDDAGIDLPQGAFVEVVEPTDELLFAVLSAIPFELLIVSIARARGLEPGALTVGNKVTIRE